MYKRDEYQLITERIKEPRKFIQVVIGARQIGKSTVVKQVLKDLDMPYQFGYEQCMDFRLLGCCAKLEGEQRLGKRYSCN